MTIDNDALLWLYEAAYSKKTKNNHSTTDIKQLMFKLKKC